MKDQTQFLHYLWQIWNSLLSR